MVFQKKRLAFFKPKPTLLTIPAALRLKVYSYVFKGSKIAFDPFHRIDRTRPIRQAQHDVFTTTDHWQLLLTCKRIYNEGRIVFCKASHYSSGDASKEFLADKLSDFSRWNLEVLEGGSTTSLAELREKTEAFPHLKTWYMQHTTKTVDAHTLTERAAKLNDSHERAAELFKSNQFKHYAKICEALAHLRKDDRVRKIKLVVKIVIHGYDHAHHLSIENNIPWPSEKPIYPQYVS